MSKTMTPAVGYIRMSTDRQEDSPERQRRQIVEYAERNGYKILRWYEDHGMTGTESKKRADYLQLLEDAQGRTFQAVLISEQSRLSREDLFEVIPHWGMLHKAGVRLVSCQRGALDFSSLGGFITAIVDQYAAHDESRKIADRVVTGRLLKVSKGIRTGGVRVFAFDREIVDPSGAVLKRLNFRDCWKKPDDCKTVLLPSSETAAVDAVRWAFDSIAKGLSSGAIADEFNRRDLKTVNGASFTRTKVLSLLRNPVYAGFLRAGAFCRGKFRRMDETDGPILRPDSHQAIVSVETFQNAQRILNARAAVHATHGNRAFYLLSRLVRCAHCGSVMSGNRNRVKRKGKWEVCPYYICPKYADGRNAGCSRPTVHALRLESAVVSLWWEFCLPAWLRSARCQTELESAVARTGEKPNASVEEQQLKAIRDRIEKASTNLAFADCPDDFRAVSRVISDLRNEETALRDRITKATRATVLTGEAAEALGRISEWGSLDWSDHEIRNDVELACDLSVALHETISEIRVGRALRKNGACTLHEWYGSVSFIGEAGEQEITDAMLAAPKLRKFRKLADFVRESGRVVSTREVAEHFEMDPAEAGIMLRRAEIAGDVTHLRRKGWSADVVRQGLIAQ